MVHSIQTEIATETFFASYMDFTPRCKLISYYYDIQRDFRKLISVTPIGGNEQSRAVYTKTSRLISKRK